MRHAFLCDFDGTASPSDIGAAFARRFSREGAAEKPAFLERWMRGEMGHRELTEAQCALLTVSHDEAIAFARPYAVDPHFAPFVREAESRGDTVSVVSEGFDFYVRDLLERAGLGALPWSANVLRFENGRVRPEFPNADGCGRCGNCKGTHVRAWRARGYRTVLVGDGLSDRCGAREADQVLARRDLLAWCREEGIAVTPFDDFADVRQWAANGHDAGVGGRGVRERYRTPAGTRPGVPTRRGAPASRAASGAARPPRSSRDPRPGTGRSTRGRPS